MRKLSKIAVIILVLGMMSISHSGVLQAELNPKLEKEAHMIFDSIMSPFCAARTLNDCPSSSAHELKNKIRAELEKGKPSEQILEEIYKSYGDQARAVPRASGFGLLAWITPIAFIGLGLIIIVWWLLTRRAPSEPPITQSLLDPQLQERINKELQKF